MPVYRKSLFYMHTYFTNIHLSTLLSLHEFNDWWLMDAIVEALVGVAVVRFIDTIKVAVTQTQYVAILGAIYLLPKMA